MGEDYLEIRRYIIPISAENIYLLNALFCEEDGFMPNKKSIAEIEPKLYSAYYRFLTKIDDKISITEDYISSLIPEIAGCITFYIASTQMFPTANKRTAAASAELFLYMNGFKLTYEENLENDRTEFSDLLQGIGSNDFDIEYTVEWFKEHSYR